MPNPLDHIRIVLVEPKEPGNIGAVARAMKNTGLSHLYLVNPPRPHQRRSPRNGARIRRHPLRCNRRLLTTRSTRRRIACRGHIPSQTPRIRHRTPAPNCGQQTIVPPPKPQRRHRLWPGRKRTDQQRNPTVPANLPHPLSRALPLPQPIASHPHLRLRTLSRNPFRNPLQTIRSRSGYAPRTRIHVRPH